MRTFHLLAWILLSSFSFALELPTGTKSVSLVLYDCTLGTGNPTSKNGPLITKDGKIHSGLIGKPKVLSNKQINDFLGAFDPTQEFVAGAGCHIPHHGIIFYDSARKPIGYYEICFGCSNVATSIEAYKNIHIDFSALKRLVTESGLPVLDHFRDYSELYNQQN